MTAFITLKMLENIGVDSRTLAMFKQTFLDRWNVTEESAKSIAGMLDWELLGEKLLDRNSFDNFMNSFDARTADFYRTCNSFRNDQDIELWNEVQAFQKAFKTCCEDIASEFANSFINQEEGL